MANRTPKNRTESISQQASLFETLRQLEKEADEIISLERVLFEVKLKSLPEARKNYLNYILTRFFSRPEFFEVFPRGKGFTESPSINDMYGHFRCHNPYSEDSHVLFFPADITKNRGGRQGFIVLLEDGGERTGWQASIYELQAKQRPWPGGYVCTVRMGRHGWNTQSIVVRENVDITVEEVTYNLHLVGEKRPDTFDSFYSALQQYTAQATDGLPKRREIAREEMPYYQKQLSALERERAALEIIAKRK